MKRAFSFNSCSSAGSSPSKSPKPTCPGFKVVIRCHTNGPKAGLVSLEFDQGPVSKHLRATFKALIAPNSKLPLINFNGGKQADEAANEPGVEGFVPPAPASFAGYHHDYCNHDYCCAIVAQKLWGNINWWQCRYADLKLTAPPKNALRLVTVP